ncbi:MAG: hypothetical protein KC731_40440, partial [Myxococcales bacterium]|nr:hypothetical protein [Myxococcales bacterium]
LAPPPAPPAPVARASAAPVPVPPASTASAPLAPPEPVPPAPIEERTLERLVAITLEPALTIAHFIPTFGSPEPERRGAHHYVFRAPFVDASELQVERRRNQNREVLDRVTVVFPHDQAPSVTDVARRLGFLVTASRIEVGHHCSHGPCPTHRLQRKDGRGQPIDVTLYLEHEAVFLGNHAIGRREASVDPKRTRVWRLSLSLGSPRCLEGEPLPEALQVKAAPASTPLEKLLVASITAAGEALAEDDYDPAAIERALGVTLARGPDRFERRTVPVGAEPQASLLGPSFQVIWDENEMSRYAWILLLHEREGESVPLLRFPKLDLVTDPKRLCHAWGHDHFFLDVPLASPQARFQVTLKIGLVRRDEGFEIQSLELTRAPR